jgi:hypothetical protein
VNSLDDDLGHGVWLDVGEDGSVVLPAATLSAADLTPGNRVMVRVADGVMVQLYSHISLAMEINRPIDPSPVIKALPVVDGLIVERQVEVLREAQEFNAQHHAAE